jgi:hypothetical protein
MFHSGAESTSSKVARSSQLEITVDTKNFDRMAAIFAMLGADIKPALSRALNHTGDKTRTQVARALVRQTGIKYGRIRQALRTIGANVGRLVYTIEARGPYLGLEEFSPRQTAKGVSAAPWGKRQVFPHTFLLRTAHFNGVYERTSPARYPLHRLWGPAIPVEMIKDQSKAAFERTVDAELPARIDHEISVILSGAAKP